MQIWVVKPPLHHGPSGLIAFYAGEYSFPEDPAYAGWLNGQVERGAISLTDPAAEPEQVEELIQGDGGGAWSAPTGDGQGDPQSFYVGDLVLYTAGSGNVSERRVEALNEDGTFNLSAAPNSGPIKGAKTDRMRLPANDEGA